MKQNFTVRQGALDGVAAFLSVAQHRNFRRAAAELGVTPSAISQAVRALEARVGAALFIRTTRSVGLTEAGQRFLSRAKPAFEELVRRFNAILSAKGYVWFWPKIAAALTSKHHWLVINCDSCGTVVDLDLRVKPRDPEASIRVALRNIRCPRCNGHGRPRIICIGTAAINLKKAI